MENLWNILKQPDNIPIVGMLVAVLFCLGVALRQARRNDRLMAQGKKDRLYDDMSR